jgi:hypothetical protein
MSGKKKYFPNNVRRIQNAPDEIFQPLDFEEVMDWRVCSWELPDSVACVIRCDNSETGKITEFTYQQHGSATKKLQALTEDPNNTVTIATQEAVHQLFYDLPSLLDD